MSSQHQDLIAQLRFGSIDDDLKAAANEAADALAAIAERDAALEVARAQVQDEYQQAKAVIAERDAALAGIAEIAHNGGLAGLDQHLALVALRRLTLAHWNKSGTEAESRARVLAALQEQPK